MILTNKINFFGKMADFEIFVFSDKPEHRFNIETSTFQRGPKSGLARTTVSLEIGPHKFTRGITRKNFVYFKCLGCRSLKVYLQAKAQQLSNGDFNLVQWPHFENHVCTDYITNDFGKYN